MTATLDWQERAPLLALARAVLRGDALPAWSATQWEARLPDLRAERLPPLLYLTLRDTPAWGRLPASARAALADDFRWHSMRLAQIEIELEAIAAMLAGAGIPLLLLKGLALSRQCYRDKVARPIGDLDLLIHAEHLATARRLLAARGYVAQGLYLWPRWQQRFRAELPLVCRAPARAGLLVELHWSLVELPYYIDRIRPSALWRNASPAADLPTAGIPDATTLLLHACAHQALHHSDDQQLIWLIDVDRLIASQTFDWTAVVQRAAEWQMMLPLQMVVQASRALLGTPLPPDAAALLTAQRPDAVEYAMWGLGDERPGRAWRRAWQSWRALPTRSKVAYGGWVVARGMLAAPEAWIRRRQPKGSADV